MQSLKHKNLSQLSAQLFLGTALVVGGATFASANNATGGGDETGLNTVIATINGLDNTAERVINITTGDITAAGDLTAFTVNGQTVSITADAPRAIITTGHAGIAGPINLKTDGDHVITLTTATSHIYSGSTTIAGTGGLTTSASTNVLPAGTSITLQGGATYTKGGAQTVVGLTTVAGTTVAGAGALTLQRGNVAGVINAGALTKNQSGGLAVDHADNTLTLAGNNTFNALITINGGTVVSSHANGLGNAAGALTFAGTDGKDLQISGAAQTKTGNVTFPDNNGLIRFNTATDLILEGNFAGGGTTAVFTKLGVGKLAVGNGTANSNTYNGTATVSAGTLEVKAGSTITNLKVDVSQNAIFMPGSASAWGTSTINNLTLAAGAILRIYANPADQSAFNKIAVGGDLRVNATSANKATIQLYLGASATPAQSYANILAVTGGIVGEDGTTDLAANTNNALTDRFTVTVVEPTNYTATLSYATKNFSVNVTQNAAAATTTTTATTAAANVQAANSVQAAADKVENPVAKAALREVVERLQDAAEVAQLNSNGLFTKVSEEINKLGTLVNAAANEQQKVLLANQFTGAANQTAAAAAPAAMSAVTGAVSNHTSSALGGANAAGGANTFTATSSAKIDQGFVARLINTGLSAGSKDGSIQLGGGLWIQGFGGWQSRNTWEKAPGAASLTKGVSLGLDTYLAPGVLAGFSLQYAHIDSDVHNKLGESKTNSYSGSVFYGVKSEYGIFDASVTVGTNRYNLKRTASITAGDVETGTAKTKSLEFAVQTGFKGFVARKSVDLMPFVGVGYMHSKMDGFKESGFTSVSLTREVKDFSSGIVTPSFGLTFTRAIKTDGGTWTPSISIGYKGMLPMGSDTMESKQVVFQKWGTAKDFLRKYHTATLGLGGVLVKDNGYSVNVAYDGALGRGIRSHDVMVRVAKKF